MGHAEYASPFHQRVFSDLPLHLLWMDVVAVTDDDVFDPAG
jgi:hypothetical protein